MNERPPATSARPANLLHAIGAAAVAAVALGIADLLVRTVPFRFIARRVEGPLRRERSDATAVRRVKWAIDAAHRRLPWNVPCLATAIAANRLLARRGIPSELWLGVKTSEQSPIDAHAWLVADGCVVTGAAGRDAFRPLHALVTAAPAR
ncbi:MAG TPA: lasso peptide biosynthesis B2 protein [Thermoanaerobaculia bacterium]|nr:lasso peptide biosynthesis B2 protein [Thermoanaerobaculia bacterium]